jgi:hypothetical protein
MTLLEFFPEEDSNYERLLIEYAKHVVILIHLQDLSSLFPTDFKMLLNCEKKLLTVKFG